MKITREMLGGTPLKETDFQKGKVLYFDDTLRTRYNWDAGVAMGKFLKGLKQGKILGVRCSHCQRVVTPPRVFCEECFAPISEWVELADTGVIDSFSICYVRWDASRIEKPELPAIILLDGAERAGFMHLLGEVEPKEIKIGMRVQAVWKPEEERSGSILDIKYFKPIK